MNDVVDLGTPSTPCVVSYRLGQGEDLCFWYENSAFPKGPLLWPKF